MANGIFGRYGDMLGCALRDMLPRWARQVFLAEPRAKLLRFETGEPRGSLVKPVSILTTLGDSSGRGQVVDVVLPGNMLLKRVIPIPASNPGTHSDIAALDLVRRTPFAPSDVYWALEGNRTAKTTELTQWIAKRSDIAQYRTNLATHGLKPRQFLIADGRATIPLADFTQDIAPKARMWRQLNAALLVLIIGFGLSIWLQPGFQARADLQRDTATVERLRSEALQLRSDIAALEQIDSDRTAFVNTVMRRPRFVDAMRQLTVALPDHVWISDLLFTESQITLNGETAQSAADLVLELTRTNTAYVPALTGPVSRTGQGNERFGIVFTAQGTSP